MVTRKSKKNYYHKFHNDRISTIYRTFEAEILLRYAIYKLLVPTYYKIKTPLLKNSISLSKMFDNLNICHIFASLIYFHFSPLFQFDNI